MNRACRLVQGGEAPGGRGGIQPRFQGIIRVSPVYPGHHDPSSLSAATLSNSPPWHLHAQGLACRRGERLLFQHLDLSVMPGQAVWVRGPNGRGKTSLLRVLAGLSRPDGGHIQINKPLVYIGHQQALKDDLTALEALSFLVRLHRLPSTGNARQDADTIAQALAHMGVHAQRHALVRTLSQGQRRRVALARLVLSPPGSVWLLDEPFDALDDQGVTTLNALIEGHRQSGGAVVLTSHQTLTLPDLAECHLDQQAAR